MKTTSIIGAILLLASQSASAIQLESISSKEDRDEIIRTIPERLSQSWPESARAPHILACMSSAYKGNDAALASLMIIADSADIIKARVVALEQSQKSSKSKKEVYERMQSFNTTSNFKKAKLAANKLPDALKYCQRINEATYNNAGIKYDPIKSFAEEYLQK